MPRDISGNYTLPAGNPVVDDTIIDTTWGNGTMNDIAAQLNNVVTKDGVVGPTAPLKGANGTAAAPMWSFTAEPGMGMYRIGAGVLGFAVAGALALSIAAGGLSSPSFIGQMAGPSGSAGAPSYSFTGDLNTGWSAAVADTLVGSTAGLNRLQIGPTGNIVLAAPSAGVHTFNGINAGTSFVFNGTTRAIRFGFDATSAFLDAVDNPITTFTPLRLGGSTLALHIAGTDEFTISATRSFSFATSASGVSGFNVAANRVIGNAWDNKTIVIGSTATSTSGALGLSYDDTTGATIESLVPGTAHKPLTLDGSTLVLKLGGTTYLSGGASGNWTFAAPASGITIDVSQIAGTSGIRLSSSLSGGSVRADIVNSSNTANSNAFHFISVAGATAADAYTTYDISGVQDWSIGVDNSDSDTYKIDSSAGLTTATNRLNVTTDGRWYGNALHNNGGAVTGTTNQYVASGTYTPTLTNVANCSVLTAAVSNWTRVGNVVTVASRCTITTTLAASTTSSFGISLPVASNLAAVNDLSGTGVRQNGGANEACVIDGDAANDRANLEFNSTNVGPFEVTTIFQYVVL